MIRDFELFKKSPGIVGKKTAFLQEMRYKFRGSFLPTNPGEKDPKNSAIFFDLYASFFRATPS